MLFTSSCRIEQERALSVLYFEYVSCTPLKRGKRSKRFWVGLLWAQSKREWFRRLFFLGDEDRVHSIELIYTYISTRTIIATTSTMRRSKSWLTQLCPCFSPRTAMSYVPYLIWWFRGQRTLPLRVSGEVEVTVTKHEWDLSEKCSYYSFLENGDIIPFFFFWKFGFYPTPL